MASCESPLKLKTRKHLEMIKHIVGSNRTLNYPSRSARRAIRLWPRLLLAIPPLALVATAFGSLGPGGPCGLILSSHKVNTIACTDVGCTGSYIFYYEKWGCLGINNDTPCIAKASKDWPIYVRYRPAQDYVGGLGDCGRPRPWYFFTSEPNWNCDIDETSAVRIVGATRCAGF